MINREIINKEIIEKAEDLDMDVEAVLFFCFGVWAGIPGFLIDKGMITSKNEHEYRINFTVIDDEGRLTLRHPLFARDSNASFDEYVEKLRKGGLQINGFGFNLQSYSIFTTDEETISNYNKFVLLTEKFDLDRLVEVTLEYYRKLTMAKKLSNFLLTDAPTMYKIA